MINLWSAVSVISEKGKLQGKEKLISIPHGVKKHNLHNLSMS